MEKRKRIYEQILLTSKELNEICIALKLRADALYAKGEKKYAKALYDLEKEL